MKLFHLSDLHIGVGRGKDAERHKEEVLRRLDALLKKAEAQGAFVIIAGDVFDSNYVPLSFVEALFEVLRSCSVPVVMIPGGGSRHREEISGHDAYTKNSIYRRLSVVRMMGECKNLHFLIPDKPSKLVDGVAFYAGFFQVPSVNLIENAKFHIAVLHGAFGNGRGEVPIEENPFHYVALGHYHAFKRVASNAYYSGAFVQFEFLPRKDAVSGYLEVFLEPELRVERIVFEDAPRFVRLSVMTDSDLRELAELVRKGAEVKVEAYREEFREELLRLGSGVRLDGAYPVYSEFFARDVLDECLEDVSSEVREEVVSLITFALQYSSKKSDIVKKLREIAECWGLRY